MSGRSYLLDTNVLIGFLAGVDWAVEFVNHAIQDGAELFISVITRMELLGFPGITQDEESKIGRLLSQIRVIGISSEIEAESIVVRKATGLKLPDAIISGTAISIDAVLVSEDSDFEKVEKISFVNPSSR